MLYFKNVSKCSKVKIRYNKCHLLCIGILTPLHCATTNDSISNHRKLGDPLYLQEP